MKERGFMVGRGGREEGDIREGLCSTIDAMACYFCALYTCLLHVANKLVKA